MNGQSAGYPSLDLLRGLALAAAVLVAATVLWATDRLKESARQQVESTLKTVLAATTEAVDGWMSGHKRFVESQAARPELRLAVVELLKVARDARSLLASDGLRALRGQLRGAIANKGYQGFFVLSAEGESLASLRDENVGGRNLMADDRDLLRRVFGGETLFSSVVPSDVPLNDHTGRPAAGRPTMFVVAPVRDGDGGVIAALAFRIAPHDDFVRIARIGGWGRSGETYIFDRQGRMISGSRFEKRLEGLGLLRSGQSSLLGLRLRDPGGDLTRGYVPRLPGERQPLNRMARSALAGERGVDLDGYRDYRGVPVVGAWHFDLDGRFGMASEIDLVDAYRVYFETRRLLLLALAVVVLTLAALVVVAILGRRRAKRMAEEATAELRRRNRELANANRWKEDLNEALRRSEERFTLAMRGAQDGLWDWDVESDRVYYSPRWGSMLGYGFDDLEPTFATWERLVHPEDLVRVKTQIGGVLREKHSHFLTEFRMRHRKGHWVEVLSRGVVVYDHPGGQALRVVGTHVDITERNRFQRALGYENRLLAVLRELLRIDLVGRPLEACLEEALDKLLHAPFAALLPMGGVFVIRGEGLELVAQRNFSAPLLERCARVPFGYCHCGRAAAERRFIHTDCRDGCHDNHFEGGGDHGHYVVPLEAKGRVRGVLVLYLPHRHPRDEQEVRFLESAGLVLASVIEQKQAERALVKEKKRAEAANRAKSEFLANMSHELRTPMHAILSFADLGEGKVTTASPEGLARYFRRIHDSGDRLLRLLNNLLDLAKLEAGRMEFQPRPLDLVTLAREAFDELEGAATEGGVRLELDPPEGDPVALCDGAAIGQLLRNLIGNAVKFSPPGGTVRVAMRSIDEPGGESAVELRVSDQGGGIPEGELESVFDKFVQSSATDTGAGGTGLGLAICREIVHGHGGTIHAENNPSGGATFVLRLPRRPLCGISNGE